MNFCGFLRESLFKLNFLLLFSDLVLLNGAQKKHAVRRVLSIISKRNYFFIILFTAA